MLRPFRPSFEKLENREVYSANPLSLTQLAALDATRVYAEASSVNLNVPDGSIRGRASTDGNSQKSLPPIRKIEIRELRALDIYGDSMSVEDWMDWTAQEHDPTNGDSIFDFPGGRGR